MCASGTEPSTARSRRHPRSPTACVFVGGDRVYAFKTAADSDHDGLADVVETNDGVFSGPGHTGTTPHNPDTDGDGIKDGDEVFGTPAGVDLPAMGANPLHKDLFIEADWYSTTRTAATRTAPASPTTSTDASGRVHQRTGQNPDGNNGVNLVIDYGQGGAFTGGNLVAGDGNITGDVNGAGSSRSRPRTSPPPARATSTTR